MNLRKTLFAGGAGAFACLLAGAAHGQTVPNCNDPTMFPNPIYIAGSSAFEPTAGNMAVKLAALTGADKVTLIYKGTSSCDGPAAIRDNTSLMGNADYFTPNAMDPSVGDKHSCALDIGTKADVGVSDIFYENCPGNTLPIPDGLTDVQGPVQAMIFIVPETNKTNTDLTYEEANAIWGCGMNSGVTPFTSDADIMQRNSGSGTQGVVAKSIGVAAGAFKGMMNASGGNLVTALKAADATKAIGFLAADSYDTQRDTLNALAFRALSQTKAFYADSTAASFDKKNVRDGHYVVWGPEHFFAAYDKATKKITNAKAEKFIGWINGNVSTTAFNYIDVEAKAGVIPQCAMKVTRDQDGGFIRPFTPAGGSCGCRFESVATKATPAGCMACTADTECTGGKKCLNNFCE